MENMDELVIIMDKVVMLFATSKCVPSVKNKNAARIGDSEMITNAVKTQGNRQQIYSRYKTTHDPLETKIYAGRYK